MSSKSRHNHKPRKPQEDVDHVSHVDGGQAALPSIEDFDEVIHVPEGKSRFQFIFLIGLLIFLLIIFIIPSAFQNAVTGGSGSGDALPGVSWTTAKGDFSMTSVDFTDARRLEDAYRRMTQQGGRRSPSPEETATTLLLDHLSREAGVYISDTAVIAQLRQLLGQTGNMASYKGYLNANFPGGTAGFEKHVRGRMRIQRYMQLIGRVAAKPLATEMVSAWEDQHAEHAFDYIQAEAASFSDEAMKVIIGDAALETWFGERPDWEQNAQKTEDAWRLGAAYINIGEAAPAALFERYPLAAEFDPVAEGEKFYSSYSFQAFKLDEPRTDDEGKEIRYKLLEEVTDEVAVAAAAQVAMNAWRADIKDRQDRGITVDLAAEAAELGVSFIESKTFQERSALVEDTRHGGGPVTGQLTNTETGALLNGVLVTAEVLEIVSMVEHREPALPAFAEYREAAAEAWAKDYGRSLAMDHMIALRGDHENLDAAGFAALVEGDPRVTMGVRDWLERTERGEFSAEPSSLLFMQAEQYGFFALEEGEMTDAIESFTKDTVFIVRSLGKRMRDFSEASPADLDAVRTSMSQKAMGDFLSAYGSEDEGLPQYLVDTYQLALPQDTAYKLKTAAERAEREANLDAEGADSTEG